ncbi:MAG TPA: hypothetical protein VG146_04440 [Verrucomicrobiae bacterium]|nr:hypothetical protein [Verrucomicrobiae bacterium]
MAVKWLGPRLALGGLLVSSHALAVGSWSALVNTAPDSVALMLQLSDGTVMAANNTSCVFNCIGSSWYRLTPDGFGNYANGNWTTLASMNDSRLFYSSEVLTDGRVFVAGGEYGSGGATAEIFDPLANGGAGSWTYINPPTSLLNPSKGNGFVDAQSKVLPNGDVLEAPINPAINNGTLIYNPSANTWSQGPQSVNRQVETSWVKLPDDSILTVDPLDGYNGEPGTNSERYIPSLGQWVPDANLPVNLWVDLSAAGLVGEIGPAFLLPDGRAFFLGGSGHTAYYTPSGNNNPGKWTQGPDIPGGLVAADAPGAMMVNGKILVAVAAPPSPSGSSANFPSPTSFFEFDYTAGTNGAFAQTGSPTGGLTDNISSYQCAMLVLPSGNVLYCHFEQGNIGYSGFGSQLYVYHPDTGPLAAGKPAISSITLNSDGSYHLVGTGLNGISEGAAFGDDAQMNGNYPLVRLTDYRGHVYYGRTYNWNSTSVHTGRNLVTTEFTVPVAGGSNSLVVVANGIASDPVTFYGPVWVDFNNMGIQNGTYQFPLQTLAAGVSLVATGGTIAFKANVQPSVSPETMTISKPMTLISVGGPATIGQ